MTDDPRDFIDWDEGRDFPSPFYANAEPCESCGEPTFRGRVWNPEHGLWIATDCQCNTPHANDLTDGIRLGDQWHEIGASRQFLQESSRLMRLVWTR
jgi:hypothetical protein